jgi:hypothetical protein
MIVLAAPFRLAMRDERLPTAYPFMPTAQLHFVKLCVELFASLLALLAG